MFEGKNIHFSPVDNKPLCSYSSKLCRQRRLNGYAFCIRHILEDQSAPFKRCTYVTRNNNQICQNAIPTSQERGYCHSHMQVAGIIPKTERKVKNPPVSKSTDTTFSTATLKSDSNGNTSNKKSSSAKASTTVGSNIVKKDPNAVFKFEEEPSEIQWIPKGGSINGIVNGGKVTSFSPKGKDLLQIPIKTKEVKGNGTINGKIFNGVSAADAATKTFAISARKQETKNGKLNHTLSNGHGQSTSTTAEEKTLPTIVAKCRQTYGKKPNNGSTPEKLKITQSPAAVKGSTTNELLNLTPPVPHHQPVKSIGKSNDKKNTPASSLLPVEPAPAPCAPENLKYFDQFKTLKSVEKSVSAQSVVVADHPPPLKNVRKQTHIPRTIGPLPTQESKANTKISCKSSSSGSISIESCSSSAVEDLLNSVNAQKKVSDSLAAFPILLPPDKSMTAKCAESRQEFLSRVRVAFKSQYLTIRNSAQDSDKSEKIWKRALRNSLLTCVVKDSLHCAHVIAENDPKKYSTFNQNTVSGRTPAAASSLKHKKPTTPTAAVNNGKGKQAKKNSVIDDSSSNNSDAKPDAKSSTLKSQPNFFSKALNGTSSSMLVTDIVENSSSKSKSSKRKPAASPPDKEKVVKERAQSKRKSRKVTETTRPSSATAFMNGTTTTDRLEMDSLSLSPHTQPRSISNYKSSSNSSTIDFDDVVQASNAKKRKCDMLNGTDSGTVVTFRVPKLDDCSSLEMDTNHGQLAFNSFNGHISNHPLLHPHSGAATTTGLKGPLSNAQVQLQHLLNQPDLRTLASNTKRNHGIDTVLNSVGSSDMGTSDGVITDASFDSTFDHSVSSQQDCEFSDDDLEKSLEFQIDPETEHQASRLLEDNELTEDDLNELFPETSNKLGRSDLSDLGDFSSAFDANDIDYSLFANIFPFSRSSQSESISVSNQY